MLRYPVLISALCLCGALGACERRPTDPPKPSTLAAMTPATAGLAGAGDRPDAAPPHGPASDPPKVPLPPPQPPSQPTSAGGPVR